MVEADQDCLRLAGRSIRGMSSLLKGAVSARQAQKSVESFSRESCARSVGVRHIMITAIATAKIGHFFHLRDKLPSGRTVKRMRECARQRRGCQRGRFDEFRGREATFAAVIGC